MMISSPCNVCAQHLKLRRVLILLELLGVLVDSVVGQVDTLVPQLLLPSVERLRGEPAQVTAHYHSTNEC